MTTDTPTSPATPAPAAATRQPYHFELEAKALEAPAGELAKELRTALERETGPLDKAPDEVRPHILRALTVGADMAGRFAARHAKGPGSVILDVMPDGRVQVQVRDADRKACTATLTLPPEAPAETAPAKVSPAAGKPAAPAAARK
jgi:hypothetical protein